jgi:hypothetical protein
MVKLTYLPITKSRAKYNDVLRKGLSKLNISFVEKSTKFGKILFVDEKDENSAQMFMLSVSLINPRYI